MKNQETIKKELKTIKEFCKDFQNPIVTEIGDQTGNPFKVLISCVLSLRTRDEITGKVAKEFPWDKILWDYSYDSPYTTIFRERLRDLSNPNETKRWLEFGFPTSKYQGPFNRETERYIVDLFEEEAENDDEGTGLHLIVHDKKEKIMSYSSTFANPEDYIDPHNLEEPRGITLMRSVSDEQLNIILNRLIIAQFVDEHLDC